MKDKNKSRQSKGSIAKLVLGLIKAKGLHDKQGKDASVILLPQVKKQFPGSKFNLAHVYWYLGRYRRQLKAGKPVDHIAQLMPGKTAAKPVAKAKAKPSAKKVAKVTKAVKKAKTLQELADVSEVVDESND